MSFPRGISPKGNLIMQLEFELASFAVAVKLVHHRDKLELTWLWYSTIYLTVRFQLWRFVKCKVHLHYHNFQVHTDPKWGSTSQESINGQNRSFCKLLVLKEILESIQLYNQLKLMYFGFESICFLDLN